MAFSPKKHEPKECWEVGGSVWGMMLRTWHEIHEGIASGRTPVNVSLEQKIPGLVILVRRGSRKQSNEAGDRGHYQQANTDDLGSWRLIPSRSPGRQCGTRTSQFIPLQDQ